MPFPVLAVSTIILILTGASTTSYVYRDQIPALNEVLSALHNESSKAPTEIESGPSSPIEVLVDEDFPDVMKESSDLDSTVPVAAKVVNSADVKVKRYNYASAKDSTSSDPVKEEPPKISTAQVQAIVADERQTVSTSVSYSSGGGGGGGGGSSDSQRTKQSSKSGSTNSTSPNNPTGAGSDRADPIVVITYPTASRIAPGLINVTGTASDNNNVVSVEIRTGFSDYKPAISPNGNWSEWYAIVEIELGATLIQALAKDSEGNTGRHSVAVIGIAADAPSDSQGNGTDQDVVPPSISAPPDIVKEATGLYTKIWKLGTPIVSDNSDVAPSVVSNASDRGFPLGASLVKWTATDKAGNTAFDYQNVTVRDTTPPTLAATEDVTIDAAGSLTQVKLIAPAVTDAYDSAPVVTSDAPSAGFPIGTTMVNWTAQDSSGNVAKATQEITVKAISLPTVNASPMGGLYSKPVSIELLSSVADSGIFYTVDGTQPSASSARYSAPIKITSNTTLKYFASNAAGKAGPVQSQVYTIDTSTPKVTANPIGGAYAVAKSVTLTANEPGTIYYTTDDSDPASFGKVYGSPISIAATTSLKYYAKDLAGNIGSVETQSYKIDSAAPSVSASPAGGTFSSSVAVTLSSTEPNVSIFYTLDGSKPSPSSALYTKPISITKTSTLKFIARDGVLNESPISSVVFTIDSVAPSVNASPQGGIFSSARSITLIPSEPDAKIFYTTDNSPPTESSRVFSSSISITSTTTLRYFAKDAAGNIGTAGSQKYTIDTVAPKIAAPANIKREATGALTTVASIGTPTASDNIGPLTITNNATAKYALGSIKVAWTATDAAGNKATALQTITIADTTAPTVTAPPDVSIEVASGDIPMQVSLGAPAVQDLVDPSPGISNNSPKAGFPVGATTVTWTARDHSGNVATAQQKVTVSLASEPEQDKLLIRIMTINSDTATQTVIKSHLDDNDFVNNFRIPVLGQYPGQQQALNEQSIDAIRSSIANEIPASKVDVDYIEYDNEEGNGDLSTPESELVDPAAATNEAVKLIHEAGYKSGVAPTRRILMQELGGVEWAHVDYVVMQLQKVVGTQEFRDIADKVSTTTRKQNPDIVIFAQINPSLNSVEEIVEAINSIRDDIDGVGIVWTSKDAKLLDTLLTALGR